MSDPTPRTDAAAPLPPGVPDPALAEYAVGGSLALTDAERWPLMSAQGRARLEALRQHRHAPVWVHETGDRLDSDDLAALAEIDAAVTTGTFRATTPGTPAWVDALVERAYAVVPRYRQAARTQGRRTRDLSEVPPVHRGDLIEDIASFVPVDVPLDRVLEGTSSGSGGTALTVPLHPVSTAAEVLYFTDLARQAGVEWEPEPGRLGLLNVIDQRAGFTYASALTSKGGVPMARVNVHPDAWRAPGDREAFLQDQDPVVVSGHPLSLLALAELEVDLAPRVVFSGAAHLTPAARRQLERRWGVPIIDVYGTREAGLIAADLHGAPEGQGAGTPTEHMVLSRRIHVEILDAAGQPVPDGTRGEITVTVEDNPYLPLLRYRTGDTAALRHDRLPDGTWAAVLVGLEGRAPVRFASAAGPWIPSVDLTQTLQAYGLTGWHLHQDAAGGLELTVFAPLTPADLSAVVGAVERLTGRRPAVATVAPVDAGTAPKRRFTSTYEH